MTSVTLAQPGGGAARRMVRQTMIDSWYLLLGLPLAIASFTVIVTGLSVGFSTLFLLGLPIAVGTLYAARGFAELERLRIRPVLRVPVVHPRYRPAPPDASLLRRLLAPMADGQYWLDVVHGVLVFAVSTVTSSLMLLWWGMGLVGLFDALFGWFKPGRRLGID